MKRKRKYRNGELVSIPDRNFKLMVVNAKELLKGWRYELGFQKKDGTIDKRRITWFFWETDLRK